MRVAELHIEGFGRLANLSVRFSPGLNLVCAPNEAGKTTLQEALLALLYGFPAESLAAAYKPWDAAAVYAASLTYTLDAGQGYRVARRFLPAAQAMLYTHPTGEDISARFNGQCSFAEAHWGLNREAFESLCVARQGGLGALQGPGAVAAVLRQRLAAAPPDVAVARATDLLETALKERVGAPHSRTRPMAQALARLARLEEERQRALRVRRTLAPRLAELRQAGERLVQLDARRAELLNRQALLQERAAHVAPPAATEASTEVRRCEAEVAKWQPWAAFPVHLRDSLLRLSAQRSHLQQECALAEQRGRRAQQALAALEAQEAALDERPAKRAGDRHSSAADLARIQALASEWRLASELEWSANERQRTTQPALEGLEQRLEEEHRILEPTVPAGLAGLALIQDRLRQARQRLAQARGALAEATAAWARVGMKEADYQRLDHAVQEFRNGTQPEPKPEPRSGRRWLASLLGRSAPEEQAPSGLVTHAEIRPIHAEMARCRADAEAAQRALSDIEATTLWQLGKLLGGTLEDAAFDQLRARLERHLQAEAEFRQQQIAAAGLRAEVDQARDRREKAQQALQIELSRLGFAAPDLHQALAAYVQQTMNARQAAELAEQAPPPRRATAELEVLRARAEAQRMEVERWQERQAALAGVESEIAALLTQAGIARHANDVEAALKAFDEGAAHYRQWEQARVSLDAAMRYERALLQAQPRTPGLAQADEAEAAECAAALEQLEGERARTAETCANLEAEVQQAMVGVRHLAEIDEEIALEQSNVRRLEEFRSALELARDEIAEAGRQFQQQFGPGLESRLGQALKQVTAGRIAEVAVERDGLSLAVRTPGLESLVSPDRLSAATRDLAYLLLRTELARLMGRCGEKLPLLLDEPLAQCDQGRLEQALEQLEQLAEETQVLLFTADDRLRGRFEKRCSRSPRHQLHLLSAN